METFFNFVTITNVKFTGNFWDNKTVYSLHVPGYSVV